MCEGLKKIGAKKQKIKNSSSSAFVGTRGEEVTFPECLSMALREDFCQIFGKRLRPMLPSNANFLLRVPLFPECCTRGRWLSPSATLRRVPWFLQHLGKPLFPECISSPSS
jgi:hypothetical protein